MLFLLCPSGKKKSHCLKEIARLFIFLAIVLKLIVSALSGNSSRNHEKCITHLIVATLSVFSLCPALYVAIN